MRTAVFDLETSSLYANSGIILCASIKTYGTKGVTTFRADEYKSWKTGKSDNKELILDTMKCLSDYDIFVAHNGTFFDKPFLNASCIKYGLKPDLRFEKFIDPVALSRRHLRMARNSLTALIDYFDIEDQKTPIQFKHWLQASLDSNTNSMDVIVRHCERDVLALESVYEKVKSLVRGIDDGGSSR